MENKYNKAQNTTALLIWCNYQNKTSLQLKLLIKANIKFIITQKLKEIKKLFLCSSVDINKNYQFT